MDKSTTEIQCPACGASHMQKRQMSTSLDVPYGPKVDIQESTFYCETCDTLIDDKDDNDLNIINAIDTSRRESITAMLDVLSKRGYSLAAIERALELPQRTLSRWKTSTDISAIGLALLRIIRTFPWLLHVAEAKYDPISSRNIYVQNAVSDLMKIADSAGYNTIKQLVYHESTSKHLVIARYEFEKPTENNTQEFGIEADYQVLSSEQTKYIEVL